MVKMDIKSASKEWATAAMEIFKSSLSDKDIKLCKSIIADVLDAGHYKTAREMNQLLRDNYSTKKTS